MKKLIITLLSVGLLGAVGCGPNETTGETNPYKDAQKRQAAQKKEVEEIDGKQETQDLKKEVATNYANIAAQAYKDSYDEAVKLQTAVRAFVAAAEAYTGDGTDKDAVNAALKPSLEAAQSAWKKSREPYLQTEVFRFYDGPINSPNKKLNDEDDADMETRVNAWPLDESYIDYTCDYNGVPEAEGAPDSSSDWHCDPLKAKPKINDGVYNQSIIGNTAKFTELDNYDTTADLSTNVSLFEALRGINQSGVLTGQGYGVSEYGDLDCPDDAKDENDPRCEPITSQWVPDKNDPTKKIYVHHVPQGDANVSTGYHAIEFILWGQDFNPTEPGSRNMSDFVPNAQTDTFEPNAKRRLNYLQAVTDMLVYDLKWLADQWKADSSEDNYRKEFLADPSEAFKKIFNGMKNLSVDETGGERIQPAVTLENQEEEHSCFSDNTHVDMDKDIQGIVNVFNGTYKSLEAGKDVSGKGAREVLKLYVPLCKKDMFKDEPVCKNGFVSVEKLDTALNNVLTQAKGLLKSGTPGRESFDQMVLKHWPAKSSTKNKGHDVLQSLADDLAKLDDNYTAFAKVLHMQFWD